MTMMCSTSLSCAPEQGTGSAPTNAPSRVAATGNYQNLPPPPLHAACTTQSVPWPQAAGSKPQPHDDPMKLPRRCLVGQAKGVSSSFLAPRDAIGDRGSDRGLPRHEENGDLIEARGRVEKKPVEGPNSHDGAPSLRTPDLLRGHSCAESSEPSADSAADKAH